MSLPDHCLSPLKSLHQQEPPHIPALMSPPLPCPGNLSIGAWNVCGWSLDPAHKLWSNVLKALDLDIVCLSESFLQDERSINIEGYSWFGITENPFPKEPSRDLVGWEFW